MRSIIHGIQMNIKCFVTLMALALLLTGCTTTSPREEIPLDVQVMTFNIRYDNHQDGENSWDKRKALACQVVRDEAPSVLGLQEANRHQLDDFRTALPEYSEVGVGRDGGTKGEHSAILYQTNRFKLDASGTFWLSETPTTPSRDWDSVCRRICTWARFTEKRSKQSFFVYNTHLDHKSQLARMNGLQLILAHIAARSALDPVILMGDLNVPEDNAAIGLLKGSGTPVLVDSFRSLNPREKAEGTHHSFKGGLEGAKIDYIFVSPSIRTLDAKIVRTNMDGRYPSDHFPVTAHLRFEKQSVSGRVSNEP